MALQAKLWQWAAVAYTVAASLFFAFMPLVPVQTASGSYWVSPFSMLGIGVFGPLLLPTLLTLIPIVIRRRRVLVAWICTGVLALLCLLLALSWGIVYLPAPLIAAGGAYLTARAPIEDVDMDDKPWQVPRA